MPLLECKKNDFRAIVGLLSACAGRNDKIWDQKRVSRSRNGRQSSLSCPPAVPSPSPPSAREIAFSVFLFFFLRAPEGSARFHFLQDVSVLPGLAFRMATDRARGGALAGIFFKHSATPDCRQPVPCRAM